MEKIVMVNGVKYSYSSQLVDTDYGPENKVSIYKDGKLFSTWQEAASTSLILEWFKDSLLED